MSLLELPVRLLRAISRFASDDEARVIGLQCVRFTPSEIVACDGHRLVRLATTAEGVTLFEPTTWGAFHVQRRSVAAVCSAANDRGKVSIGRAIDDAIFTIDGRDKLRIHTPCLDESEGNYPPIDQVMVPGPPAAADAGAWRFNPRFVNDVREVVEALDTTRGVSVTGWQGGPSDPFQIETPGARFVIMGMRA